MKGVWLATTGAGERWQDEIGAFMQAGVATIRVREAGVTRVEVDAS